nr:putative DNA binding domain-containing protein [Candidatus Cloacimonadota bacterium]
MKKLMENEVLEFKKSTSEMKEAIISICSILNKHAKGELYFGIKNTGSVIGQDVTETTLRKISQSIGNNIEPKIYPKIEKMTIEEKDCIKIAFSGTEKPYFAFGRAYIRVADEDRKLSPKELKDIIISAQIYNNQWDSELSDLTIDEVEPDTFRQFVLRAKQSERMHDAEDTQKQILEKLNLAKNNKLSLAAKFLFTTKHNMEIQTAVFAGKDKLTFLDIKKYNHNLFDLLEKAESYVKEKMNWRVEFIDFKRAEIPEVPLEALREALVNSLNRR